MLGRSAVLFGPGYDDRAAMVLFTYGSPAGDLAGLAVMEQQDLYGGEGGPERQFAFALFDRRDETPSVLHLIANLDRGGAQEVVRTVVRDLPADLHTPAPGVDAAYFARTMLVSAIVYLAVKGQDLGLAAST